MNIYEQKDKNIRATWITLIVFILFFLGIGLGFDHYYGVGAGIPVFSFAGIVIGLGSALGSYFYGDKIVLSSCGVKELDPNNPAEKQWQNVVEEMAIAAGIPVPKMYVIPDTDPNAFATGRDPEHSSIVVTRGLLNALNRDELQGVAAHEMSHIRNYDIRFMLVLAALVGAIALISDWAGRALFRSNRRSRSKSKSSGRGMIILFVIWIVAVILAPVMARLLAMCVSRRREYLADASAAELTRNPLGLASALEKISAAVEPTRSIKLGSAHLCIADPSGSKVNMHEGGLSGLFATHPPIVKRVEILKQMAYS
jgi:heat shock protein HtpX